MKKPGKMIAEALRSVLAKPATVMYPQVKVQMPARFRGKLDFHPERCVCCKLCMRDCPTRAIEVRKVGEKHIVCEIDFSKCIFCAQCVDVCPKDALEATREFELAEIRRSRLKVVFDVSPSDPPPGAPQKPSA
jgi:formate hydrogenlyase subunit 6/NADH:ubiquinone oxidoreductase subunit I